MSGLEWTSPLSSGHHIRHRACVSWVVLLASMTPRVPEASASPLYWQVRGNSDASCICGNNSHSCSAKLHSKYDVSRSRERTRLALISQYITDLYDVFNLDFFFYHPHNRCGSNRSLPSIQLCKHLKWDRLLVVILKGQKRQAKHSCHVALMFGVHRHGMQISVTVLLCCRKAKLHVSNP